LIKSKTDSSLEREESVKDDKEETILKTQA
jgi:hypothetical protein